MKVRFNMNAIARVVLTAPGAHRLRTFNDSCKLPTRHKAGDAYEDTLWSIMNIFGPSLFNGGLVQFEGNEIEIEER